MADDVDCSDEIHCVAHLTEEQCHVKTGNLAFRKSLGAQRLELRLPRGGDSSRFQLVAGGGAAGGGLRGGRADEQQRRYSFDKRDLRVHSKFIRRGKMSFASPSFGFQLLVSGGRPEELHRLLEALRQHLSGGTYRPRPMAAPTAASALADKTNSSRHSSVPSVAQKRALDTTSTPAVPSKGAVAHVGEPRQLLHRGTAADGGGTRAPAMRRACHRGSPAKPTGTSSSSVAASGAGQAGGRQRSGGCSITNSSSGSSSNNTGAGTRMSAEQAEVLRRVKEGRSVFFSGPAGSGKTFVLNELQRVLPSKSTFFLAPTALAAFHIGGCTVHRFAGVGLALGKESVETLERLVRNRHALFTKWRQVRTIVLDEVSMLNARVWDSLEQLARALRDSGKPFGGLQVIATGDFFQLPPVSSSSSGAKYCFEVPSWETMFGSGDSVLLRRVFRQRDESFKDVLNELRVGRCSPANLALLNSRRRISSGVGGSVGGGAGAVGAACGGGGSTGAHGDGIVATVLHTHKHAVDKINLRHLARLHSSGADREAAARGDGSSGRGSGSGSDGGTGGGGGGGCALQHFRALDSGDVRALQQASAPEVVSLKVDAQVVLVKTVDRALGLVNGARGVVVGFTGSGRGTRPTVRFANGRMCTVAMEEWNIRVGCHTVATRRQIPLRLAWALSVHKSQGMSLDRAEVCLGNVFEAGQAYVAISRVRSLEGLVVRGKITAKNIFADPRVVKYYQQLERQLQEGTSPARGAGAADDRPDGAQRGRGVDDCGGTASR